MELRMQSRLALATLLCLLVRRSSATASFSAIQPIVGFSNACTVAYNSPVNLCDNEDFSGVGGTGSCSADCQAGLVASQAFVQRLCSGQQAAGNSVIGHLFSGDIVNFLCSDDTAAATTTVTSTIATQTSAQSATSMATDTTSTNTQTATTSSIAATITTTESSRTVSGSGTTLTTRTSSNPTTTSSSTSSSVPTSIESATSSLTSTSSSSTTSTSASATRSSGSQGSGDGGSGGGSPFDNSSNAGSPSRTVQLQLLSLPGVMALLLAVA